MLSGILLHFKSLHYTGKKYSTNEVGLIFSAREVQRFSRSDWLLGPSRQIADIVMSWILNQGEIWPFYALFIKPFYVPCEEKLQQLPGSSRGEPGPRSGATFIRPDVSDRISLSDMVFPHQYEFMHTGWNYSAVQCRVDIAWQDFSCAQELIRKSMSYSVCTLRDWFYWQDL